MKEVVYVSGPISAPTPEGVALNQEKGMAKGAELALKGFAPIVPHGNAYHWDQYGEFNWRDYMRVDLELLKRSDTIYMMQGWEESRGARIEERYARLLRKGVIYEEKKEG